MNRPKEVINDEYNEREGVRANTELIASRPAREWRFNRTDQCHKAERYSLLLAIQPRTCCRLTEFLTQRQEHWPRYLRIQRTDQRSTGSNGLSAK